MIRFQCPTCQTVLQSPGHTAGVKVACVKCGQRLLVPNPVKPTAGNKTVLGKPMDDVVVLDVADGEDERRKPTNPSFDCPRCGSLERPEIQQKVATLGWILFVVFFVSAHLFCYSMLHIREDWEICRDCGRRARQEGSMSFDWMGCLLLHVFLLLGILAIVGVFVWVLRG